MLVLEISLRNFFFVNVPVFAKILHSFFKSDVVNSTPLFISKSAPVFFDNFLGRFCANAAFHTVVRIVRRFGLSFQHAVEPLRSQNLGYAGVLSAALPGVLGLHCGWAGVLTARMFG